jgi:hypothetical protein
MHFNLTRWQYSGTSWGLKQSLTSPIERNCTCNSHLTLKDGFRPRSYAALHNEAPVHAKARVWFTYSLSSLVFTTSETRAASDIIIKSTSVPQKQCVGSCWWSSVGGVGAEVIINWQVIEPITYSYLNLYGNQRTNRWMSPQVRLVESRRLPLNQHTSKTEIKTIQLNKLSAFTPFKIWWQKDIPHSEMASQHLWLVYRQSAIAAQTYYNSCANHSH